MRKDIFHLIQLYGREMNTAHVQHQACKQELSAVFFGPHELRSKHTAIPVPAVLKPRLQQWYDKFKKVSLRSIAFVQFD